MRWPFGRGGPRPGAAAARMLAAGYSVVDIDVRGAGASFGARPDEWPPEEAGDAAAVLDWIVSRPWSDGRVAAVGISYGGTAALLLAARGHPALRAVAARFCFWDLADDLVLPGGVRNTWLGERWAARVAVLDRGRLPIGGLRARLAVRGPRAVAGDRRDLRAALAGRGDGPADHSRSATRRAAPGPCSERGRGCDPRLWRRRPFAGRLVRRRRDPRGGRDPPRARRRARPRAVGSRRVSRRQPVQHLGRAALRHRRRGARLPRPGVRKARCRGRDGGALPRDRRGAMAVGGELARRRTAGRWRSISTPAVGCRPAAAADGADDHVLDLSASTGERTRWRGQLQPAPPTAYAGDRSAGPAYVSPPFPDGLEIAGEPACLLRLEAGADRANLFSYLDEIRPDGSATYITEGCAAGLRTVARHRARRAPADRVSDRPGKRASHVARGRRRRGVRASSARSCADPPAPRRPGAEPASSCPWRARPEPSQGCRRHADVEPEAPGRRAPIFTRFLGGTMRRIGQALGILGVALAAAACGSSGSGTVPTQPAAPLQGAAADHMRLDMMRLRLDDLGPNWRRESAALGSSDSSKCDPRPKRRQDHGRQLEEPRRLLRVWHDGADPLRRDRLRVGGRRAEDARRQHEAERHPVRQA